MSTRSSSPAKHAPAPQQSRRQPTVRAHLKPQNMGRNRSQSRDQGKKKSKKSGNPQLAARFYNKHKEEFEGLDRNELARKRFQRAILSVRSMVRFTLGFVISRRKEEEMKNMKLENSYRTEPLEGEGFKSGKVDEVVKNILEEHLANYHYDRNTAPKLARALSSVISDKVKELKFKRYKYICNVIVGENQGQGMGFCSRGLWNSATDSCSSTEIRMGDSFAVATVHGVYFE